jgi:hypothetical protein
MRNTIILQGEGDKFEAPANAAITPGQLVELLSTGKIQKQATAKADVERAFAIEDYLQGKSIGDDYATDNIVQYLVLKSGDVVLAILADGEKVANGDKLEAALAGELQKFTNGTRLAVALEACDASDSAVMPVVERRIAVRIM